MKCWKVEKEMKNFMIVSCIIDVLGQGKGKNMWRRRKVTNNYGFSFSMFLVRCIIWFGF